MGEKYSGVLLSVFAQQLRRINPDVPAKYFILVDATGKSPIVVLNQNVKAKGRVGWVASKNMNVRSCEGCTHRLVLPVRHSAI